MTDCQISSVADPGHLVPDKKKRIRILIRHIEAYLHFLTNFFSHKTIQFLMINAKYAKKTFLIIYIKQKFKRSILNIVGVLKLYFSFILLRCIAALQSSIYQDFIFNKTRILSLKTLTFYICISQAFLCV